ncbi:hypothetical protein PDE_04164 [Penicillium oxalicum 114-2]|uniref:Uncharacterized protein n=1 Tax=Penicillium oxalicum (strain 114-2 / CGMCC 5302) TaxID=933388 RepID=S7ZEW5_PENO1|nr:hypothetical protein PDE_04164 [Penicillium oxalicum 114-2]
MADRLLSVGWPGLDLCGRSSTKKTLVTFTTYDTGRDSLTPPLIGATSPDSIHQVSVSAEGQNATLWAPAAHPDRRHRAHREGVMQPSGHWPLAAPTWLRERKLNHDRQGEAPMQDCRSAVAKKKN